MYLNWNILTISVKRMQNHLFWLLPVQAAACAG